MNYQLLIVFNLNTIACLNYLFVVNQVAHFTQTSLLFGLFVLSIYGSQFLNSVLYLFFLFLQFAHVIVI